MDDLKSLEQLIQQRLDVAEGKQRECQRLLAREIGEHERRAMQFEALSERLMASLIGPRMRKLASMFPNAKILEDEGLTGHHCTCRFEHTPQYPASTKLDFGLSTDHAAAYVIVTYALEILPVFIQFDGHDQVAVPLNAVDDGSIGSWVNAKLLCFTDTYLQLQFIEQYQRENIVVDPVCGISINRTSAGATCVHEGQAYYFCVDDCCRRFLQDPAHYVARHT